MYRIYYQVPGGWVFGGTSDNCFETATIVKDLHVQGIEVRVSTPDDVEGDSEG